MSPPSKRGLCWPSTNTDPIITFTKPPSKISWFYNWSPDPNPQPSALGFIPMQWNDVNIESLGSKAASSPAILAFNEPEFPSQSNMSAALAAEKWLQHIQPLRQLGIRCGSPGISSAPQGVDWLLEFTRLIRAGNSDVDFWAVHWYGETLGQFYDYIWSTHHRLGAEKPMWITEFASTNWSTESPLGREHVEAFAREGCAYLDELDWVERYAWFGPMRDCGTVGRWAAMLDKEGKLTDLGRTYMTG